MLTSVATLIRGAARQTVSRCERCNLLLKRTCLYNPYYARVTISSSSPLRGLEEFFPPLTGKPSDVVEDAEKSGRPWKKDELRLKSNNDLHKLWYVLLKELNKLMTMHHEAERVHIFMPGGERIGKVKTSMERLYEVIKERDKAVKKAKELTEKRKMDGDVARVMEVMDYNIDLNENPKRDKEFARHIRYSRYWNDSKKMKELEKQGRELKRQGRRKKYGKLMERDFNFEHQNYKEICKNKIIVVP